MPARILIVDDDPDILSGLKKRLEWMGHQSITEKDGAGDLTAIQREAPSLMLLDLELSIHSRIDVLERNGKGVRNHFTADNGS
jgi:DNA-binding response OmpR family regulator